MEGSGGHPLPGEPFLLEILECFMKRDVLKEISEAKFIKMF